MAASRRKELLSAAEDFCSSFAGQCPPDEILSHFSRSEDVVAIEHGLPRLAPFLGRQFKGQQGIQDYFQSISAVLSYENMRFENYVVDAEVGKVSVRGEARFTWTKTKQGWDEVFTYVLEFDDSNKVKVYEIWADTGAAYLASQGQLN